MHSRHAVTCYIFKAFNDAVILRFIRNLHDVKCR